MYCKKCGSEVNNGSSFCIKCGEKISENNDVAVINQPEHNNYNVKSLPLEKCAWFAPVSIIVSFVLGAGISALSSSLLSDGTHTTYLIMSLVNILSFIIKLLPFFLFYLTATSTVDKAHRKVAFPSIFLPYLISVIPSIISSTFTYLGLYLDLRILSASTIATVSIVINILFTLIFTVLSYFIVLKYFKLVDNTLCEGKDNNQ